MTLLWPAVAVGGFFLLAALVVALATSSTARYEFERNQVQGQRRVAEVDPVPAAAVAAAPAQSASGAEPVQREAAAVRVANHPAGTRAGGPAAATAWWLVEPVGRSGEEVLAGPFPDRVDADWAALAGGRAGSAQAVHGVLRADGRLLRRPLPGEQTWLADLGTQLDRLPAEWDSPLADEDELVTLVVEIASALVEAGLSLHDCAGEGASGGVCLTPEPGRPGVLVSWHQHDRMSRDQVHGADVSAAVQATMNVAVAGCLESLGFAVEPFGDAGCVLVTG
ncbi:hypothetical protein [Modestobacter roseus]|uniref:Uncharacterized protein n=1 Tax=Modestobacter roseus TaxID=1181884 RepID=A0A562IU33_9ACTN|nr:hypothetical protein [Modestobacter roseus]MQA33012.1 hypothetical protein [Modestobacter roseus]TWH74531.1 hypothetical protein JD78_03071 [Modestobacter roseus]